MKVNVLLSTYNGEKYLSEQLDSLISQQGIDVSLTVRDDGSVDSTASILTLYKDKIAIHYYKGVNCGPARSFMDLLSHSNDEDEYFAFCDQDDVWDKDKLYIAVNHLKEYGNTPALYLGKTRLVNERLEEIPFEVSTPLLTFGESLVDEFAAGCTMVMNKTLRNIVNSYNPSYISMHDVWIYSIAMAIDAKVFYDETPHMSYRQHSSNVIGQSRSSLHEWKRRFNRLIHFEHLRSRKAYELFNGYKKIITKENLDLLNTFLAGRKSFKTRLSIIRNPNFKCENKNVWRHYCISVLLNQY